jgi:hypothetical protein
LNSRSFFFSDFNEFNELVKNMNNQQSSSNVMDIEEEQDIDTLIQSMNKTQVYCVYEEWNPTLVPDTFFFTTNENQTSTSSSTPPHHQQKHQ